MLESSGAGLVGSVERVTLSSPDAFLAAVPHLLGFPPQESVVMVGLVDDGSGRQSIRLTQRFDLPDKAMPAEQVKNLAVQATAPMAACGASSVIVAVFSEERPGQVGSLPRADLADHLVEALDARDLWVKDALFTDGASRWSYGCDNTDCCPWEGVPIRDELRTMIAAEFAGAGSAMVASREVLTAELEADPSLVAQATPRLADVSAPVEGLEEWRDGAIARIGTLADGQFPSAETRAWVIAGLADIRVRDTVLWEMASGEQSRRQMIGGLTACLRSAPEGRIAPVATVLAVQHWTSGDGARANACLDRAHGDDPDYSLAAMVATAVGSAMPPSAWTDVMAQLDRDTCRFGTDRTPAVPAPPSPAATSTPPVRPPRVTPSLSA